MTPYWIGAQGIALAQGDLITDCTVPIVSQEPSADATQIEFRTTTLDLIVVTQTCDLVNLKSGLVALCPIHRLDQFEAGNPQFAKKGQWELVRKGRVEGLHLLASPIHPDNNREALVVDFRHIA
ncbi:MAG: hypothetical protein L0Y71_15870, partial [Gemmataceae bacterium]|nr:hypothetical protein [Gemmataceae bacterium]